MARTHPFVEREPRRAIRGVESLELGVVIAAAGGRRTRRKRGKVTVEIFVAGIPLRNRRQSPDGEQLLTRISEGMTEWRSGDRVGFGLSEYLDQIVDGQPVGVAA